MRLFALLLWLGLTPAVASPPVIFTSSHIGSFYAFARLLPPAGEFTLVQVDAHDDAMALSESRKIRSHLWRDGAVVESELHHLDSGQFIEGYNWIEPLMPHPIRKIVWVAPRLEQDDADRVTRLLNTEVRAAHQPDLLVAFQEGVSLPEVAGPWVLSIDLDTFAFNPNPEPVLRALVRDAMKHRPAVVTFCVSQPYFPSHEAARAAVLLAWSLILQETDWKVRIDPRVSWGGRDRGQERRLAAQGRTWQEFDLWSLRSWVEENGHERLVYGSAGN